MKIEAFGDFTGIHSTYFLFIWKFRAGKMIPEVRGDQALGPSRKRVPKGLKGPKNTYTTITIAEKQSKRSKKGPFSLYIASPGSHPGNGINGVRRGRFTCPPPSGFSSNVWNTQRMVELSKLIHSFIS